jgi:hypothetical protein
MTLADFAPVIFMAIFVSIGMYAIVIGGMYNNAYWAVGGTIAFMIGMVAPAFIWTVPSRCDYP